MKAVAYCRVSTNTEDQLNSLSTQQDFFLDYSKKNNYNLVKIYADEGKTGTRMKNRNELIKLLSDASKDMFEVVLIKDVSRLARNTVDFLTSVRKLKSLGVKVIFVNYDQTSSDSSEFMLTLLSAIAQEESSNTSKRVKFGKKLNAEKGRVPNFIYGYDKIKDDLFSLNINEFEADKVKKIFNMYVEENMGAGKIAIKLNEQNIKTKRNCNWTQVAVSRLLTNEIYIGNIINGKEEVKDFLTGERKTADKEDWLVTHNKDLIIIDNQTFYKAQKILSTRHDSFKLNGERLSDKYVFSKMIKCSCCNSSFRRYVRTYNKSSIKWVCTGRNSKGASSCANATVIDENELLKGITDYLNNLIKDKPNTIKNILAEFNRQYKSKDTNIINEKDLQKELSQINKTKTKFMEMYQNDIIDMNELKEKTKDLNLTIEKILSQINSLKLNINKNDMLENILAESFKDAENILKAENITHTMLSKIIDRITCGENGEIDIYLKVISDVGL